MVAAKGPVFQTGADDFSGFSLHRIVFHRTGVGTRVGQ
jgi:hypothetical protein